MIFVGFGFLMTFLRRYGFSALTYNFMIAAFSIQWGGYLLHLFGNFWDQDKEDIPVKLDMDFLVDGDIAGAVILISFGAVRPTKTKTRTKTANRILRFREEVPKKIRHPLRSNLGIFFLHFR